MTARLTSNRIWQLGFGLNQRDLAVVSTLSKVRVASVAQLQRLHFPNQARTCRRVLAELVQRRVVVRLGRNIGGVRAGSAGHVYGLDVVGQSLSGSGGPAHGARLRVPWTPGPRFMDHALAVAELYTKLIEAQRHGDFELLEFQGEPECWRSFAPMGVPTILKPDAFVRLALEKHEDSYFVEVDRGTESLRTIEIKAQVYGQYFASGEEQHAFGVFPTVLWVAINQARKETLRNLMKTDQGNTDNQGSAGLHVVVEEDELTTALPGDEAA